jgi:hypothetical protein
MLQRSRQGKTEGAEQRDQHRYLHSELPDPHSGHRSVPPKYY